MKMKGQNIALPTLPLPISPHPTDCQDLIASATATVLKPYGAR